MEYFTCLKVAVFVGAACFIASPVILFFVLKNNSKLTAWVFSKLIKEANKA